MKTALVSEYRKRLSAFHQSVLSEHDPLVIKLAGDDDVVILPRSDYENLQETIYILKDKLTMASLLESRVRATGRKKFKTMQQAFKDVVEN
jgi:prevent-host-death family protein